jgi:Fe-S cluster assembly iron-binding protein IscA
MLTMTENAATAIRDLFAKRAIPETAGLRIRPGTGRALALSTSVEPEADDEIVEVEGARVFLAPGVPDVVDDKVLDAHIDTDGRIRFLLAEQV